MSQKRALRVLVIKPAKVVYIKPIFRFMSPFNLSILFYLQILSFSILVLSFFVEEPFTLQNICKHQYFHFYRFLEIVNN